MKIAICGSMKFAKEMLKIERQLRMLGHEPILPLDTNECVEDPTLNQDVSFCIENDIIRHHLKKIEESDAILVVNLKKGRTRGYIGGSTLMEMGFAHFLNKKIYLFDRIPNLSHSVEIKIMKPRVIYGDLKAIDWESSDWKSVSDVYCCGVYQQVFLGIEQKPKNNRLRRNIKKKRRNRSRSYRSKTKSCYDISRYL